MLDSIGRNIDYLRISITDRCNLRCVYCMPEKGVQMLPHEEILTYAEITRLAKIFGELGINKIKITGGEPLVRKDVEQLINDLYADDNIHDVTITTNGIALPEKLAALYAAGVRSYNISLDTLDDKKYHCITRFDQGKKVKQAIDMLLTYPDVNIKINAVMTKGMEEDCVALARYAKDHDIKVRFIELMPIGEGLHLQPLYEDDLKQLLTAAYGPLEVVKGIKGNGPCHYVKAAGFKGAIGFISSMSHKFCSSCNRLRLTCDGYLKPCLQYESKVDLKCLLRNGASDDKIKEEIIMCIKNKPKCHEFENIKETDIRGMSKIGG
ncbi:MAG: GTP 3',8-cyclase MoaA [Erysipelotrichaceae bacterium]|nr:GTP 3',8-cyclase MoaA [Erysipelotrichaceae bacterium]MDY5251161.1 GTP 3',8-cyclase MoaA [Erysipelotrichaceae bacterium]